MSQAIGILELISIVRGMEVDDAMLKNANVNLLVSKIICLGRFLLMLGGDIGAVQQATATGTSFAGDMLVDSLVPPNAHISVLPAINGLNSVDRHQAASIAETRSVAACICAADRVVKASDVTPVRVHMTFGTGGKCYMVAADGASGVNNAMMITSESAGERGLLVYRLIIPRLHKGMWRQMMEGQQKDSPPWIK